MRQRGIRSPLWIEQFEHIGIYSSSLIYTFHLSPGYSEFDPEFDPVVTWHDMANFPFSFILVQGLSIGCRGMPYHRATTQRPRQFYGRVQETSGGGEAESLIS